MFVCINGFSQLDTIHYLPPAYTDNTGVTHNADHYVVLSTNENTPFYVNMYNNAGDFKRVKISRTSPQLVYLGFQSSAWGIINTAGLNTPLDDEGMVLEADQPFFVNCRHNSNVQSVMITTKGKVAAGLEFYTGHMYTVYRTNGVNRNHFVSVMATEDNTVVTFSNPDAKYYNQSNNTFSVTLNKNQSYVVADKLDLNSWSGDPYSALNIQKANAINGTHVTATKPIVVNSGTWLGGGVANLQDMGIDQIVPIEYIGSNYIITRGRGSSNNEKVIIVASKNNTSVKINDVAVTTLANAGDHYIVNDSYYTGKNNMYIETSEPIYVYQTLAGSTSDATSGMCFIPPLNCMANSKVTIPLATQLISTGVDMNDPNGNSPALTLITKPETNFTINNVDISTIVSAAYPNNSGPDTVPGTDWVSYYIVDFNFTGFTPTGDWNFEIEGDRAINAELSIRDGAKGAGCFFSGFGEDPILSKEPILEGGTACLPDNAILRANGFPSYEWQKSFVDIPGASADSLVPTDIGFYRVRGITQCDGLTVESKYSKDIEIRPCLAINDVTVTESNSTEIVTFQVNLGIALSQDVSFTYKTVAENATPGWDYSNKIGNITISAGATTATIPITIQPDFLDEDDEVFYVELSNPVNCDFSVPFGTCTIIDDDPTPTYAFTTEIIDLEEGTDSVATFTVNLDAVCGRDTWVKYETTDFNAIAGEDYVETIDTLFFPAGVDKGTFTVPIINDDIFESGIEQFKVTLSEAYKLELNTDAPDKLVSVKDDDAQVYFSVVDTQIVEGNPMNFWILLNRPYAIDLDIDYSTQDDVATVANSDYTAVSGTVTIPAGDTSVVISVLTGDDETDENDENFKFNLSNLPTPHGLFLDPQANGKIIDDDCTPDAKNDAFTTPEEALLDGVSVMDNDLELCDIPLTFAVTQFPKHHETFSLGTGDGALSYKPVLNFFGKDTLKYSITDADGQLTSAQVIITVTNTNDVPIANDTTITILEDITTTFSPLENDIDIDMSGLKIVSLSLVSNASVSIAANETDLVFDPDLDYNGVVTFDYTMEDGEGDQVAATITVNISAQNDNPTAISDNISADEDVLSVAFDPLLNDYDADGSGLSLVSIGSASNGTLIAQGDGTYKYQPDTDFSGSDNANYTIQDGEGDQSIGVINFTVKPVNDPPVAVLENAILKEDVTDTINIFANDSDVDGNLLPSGITITQTTTNGTLTLLADGSVQYVPNPNFFGLDEFRYKLVDELGAESTEVTDKLLVGPVDDAPIAQRDLATTTEDAVSPLSISPLTNDSDPDNTGLVLSILAAPLHGNATVFGASVFYTPAPNFNGLDSILYQIKEVGAGAGTAQAYIVIEVTPVNDTPIANNDAASLDEDNTIDVDVMANDIDPDAEGIFIVSVSSPSHGSATIVSGQIRYVPNPNFFGVDALNYTIEDYNGDQNTASLTLTVDADDTDTPIANNDFVTTTEDISVGVNPVLNDLDPDLSGLTLSVVGGPTNGSVTSIVGNVITYQPAANFNGKDTIEYQIKENGSGGSIANALVVITINPVNDLPTANDDVKTIDEDNSTDIDVLANDDDPDNGGLTITSVGLALHGTTSILANQIHYVPNTNYFGNDAFTYKMEDINGDEATANVAIIVNADNTDAPIALNDTIIIDEDIPVLISPLLNDVDPDLSGLSLAIVNAPDSGSYIMSAGQITYTPNENFFGLDSIQYEVTEVAANNQTATAWILITVNPVDDLPEALEDTVLAAEDIAMVLTPLDNDIDPDRGGLTITSITSTVKGSSSISGGGLTIDYTPGMDFFGVDSIFYRIADIDGDMDSAYILLGVFPNDFDVPVPQNDTVITDEDVAVLISPLSNDYDPDQSGLTLSVVNAPDSGSYIISGSDISYTPNENFFGLDSIQYEVTEVAANNQTATAWILITVNSVDDLPEALEDTVLAAEDIAMVLTPLDNDIDPDRGGLTITSITSTVKGSSSISGGGLTIDYTPGMDFFGVDSIFYRIADIDGDMDSAYILLGVFPNDFDVPVPQNDTVITDEDVVVLISPLSNDYDPDQSGLTLSVVNAPDSGSYVISGSDISYTPNENFFGLDSIQYEVTEVAANNQTATAWILIRVDSINEIPVANFDTLTINEDDFDTVAVLLNDLDSDRGGLKVIALAYSPNSASVISNDSTEVVYIPNPDFFGNDSLYYTIQDAEGDIDSALIKVVVIYNDADPPKAFTDTFEFNEDESRLVLPMANDYDPDRSGLKMTLLSAPNTGSFVAQGDTGFIYTPPANWSGLDTAIYRIQEVAAGLQTDADTMFFITYAVNDTPIAVIDSLVLKEDSIDSVYVLLNDLDPDNVGLQVHSAKTTSNANYEVSADSTYIKYMPIADFFGNDSLLYFVADGDGDIDSAYIIIDVLADTTDVPVVYDDVVTLQEDSTVEVVPLANDYDPDRSGLKMTILAGPYNGSYILRGDTVEYTPSPNFNGQDTIAYQIQEVATGQSISTGFMIMRIDTVNERPIALVDSFTMFEDMSDTIWVLANDIDQDWEGIIIDTVSLSDTAMVVLTADSMAVVYTPSENFYGEDSLVYVVRDAQGDLDTAWIFITVVAVNDTPIAVVDSLEIEEDMSGSINLLMNDEDPDRQGLDISLAIPAQDGLGSIDVLGVLNFTPNANFNGKDSLMYYVTDKENDVDSAWVFISIKAVNDTPIVVNDFAIMLEETVIDIPILINDFDAEGPIPFDSIFIAMPTSYGEANLILGTGVVRYAPVLNFWGLDSLAYYVKDTEGVPSDTAYVYITVRNVNDLPVALNDTVLIEEDSLAVIAVLANDEDIDRSGLTMTVVDSSMYGTITILNDTVTYVPAANYFGSDTIRYIIVDGEGDTVSAIVVIDVTSVNDIPVVKDDFATLLEETAVDVPILVNDYDVEGPIPLDSIFIVSTTNNGVAKLILGSGVINYVPIVNYFGNDTIRYYVKDVDGAQSDTALVLINVINVNEAPVANNEVIVIPEDSLFEFIPMANDIDADRSGISIDSMTVPFNGTLYSDDVLDTFVYVPNANYFGLDSIMYWIVDGEGDVDSAMIYITIESVNDVPVAGDDEIIITNIYSDSVYIFSNDSDVETSITTNHVVIELIPNSGNAYINSETGYLIFEMDMDFFHKDSLFYVLTDDDGASDTARVLIYDRDSLLDFDDDGLPNIIDGDSDTADMDGIPNYLDLDSDNDMIPDAIEQLLDRDGNGIADYIDPFDWDGDSDGDGLTNRYEDSNDDGNPYNDDCDGDGVINYLDNTDNCEDYLVIPNAFSPNGDGINDLFYIEGLWNFPDAEIFIFNRWGVRVYDKKYFGNEDRFGSYDAWWNGKTNRIGKADVPEGVYFYRLSLGRGRDVKEGFIHIRR